MKAKNKVENIVYEGHVIPKTSNYELFCPKHHLEDEARLLEVAMVRLVVHQVPGQYYTVIEGRCAASQERVYLWSNTPDFILGITAIKKVRKKLDAEIARKVKDHYTELCEQRHKQLEDAYVQYK